MVQQIIETKADSLIANARRPEALQDCLIPFVSYGQEHRQAIFSSSAVLKTPVFSLDKNDCLSDF